MHSKVIVRVVVLATVFSFSVVAQVDGIANDLQIVFEQLGQEMVPNLQTSAVLNHGLGSAELGNFPHMYFSMSTGATVAPGVLEFTTDPESYDWKNYSLLNSLLDEAGVNDSDVRDITNQYAPYPSLRAGFGVGLAGGYEMSLQAGVVPQQVADLADQDGLVASITTVGGRLRKVLVRRDRGVPAISAGIGYVYSNIDFGYSLSELDPLELSDDGTETIAFDGDMKFRSTTQAFGFDVRASTRFLWIAYPFVGASMYYQISDYEAGVDGFGGTITTSSGDTPFSPAVEPFSSQEFNSFNVVLNSGFDMKLWVFNAFAHVNYAVLTRAPGAILGLRLQF